MDPAHSRRPEGEDVAQGSTCLRQSRTRRIQSTGVTVLGVSILAVAAMLFRLIGSDREAGSSMQNENDSVSVRKWLAKAPFDDPLALAAQPNFSYEKWIAEGRSLPRVADVLMDVLTEELRQPSGNGERIAYAIGWLGNKRAEPLLLSALNSKDVMLRSEATAALGRLGGREVFQKLRQLVENREEDPNVRANACISIGRIAPPGGDVVLREMLSDRNSFVASAAKEGLRLLESEPRLGPGQNR